MRLDQVFTSTFIRILCVSTVGCLAVISSCTSPPKGKNDLIGKWQVTEAYRSNRLTETLEDAYFEFPSDTSFTTNIYNEEASYNYELSGDGFTQLTPAIVEFVTEFSGKDSLKLETTLRGYDFIFFAIRDSSVVELISL